MDNLDASEDDDAELLLEKRLRQALVRQNLDSQRERIRFLTGKLNISVLDCAAALLFLCQPRNGADTAINDAPAREPLKPNLRVVRYRLDVGAKHNVTKEQIQAVLIEESGVDKKRIGRIDIRQNYTLVELPDGMPADIFQLLAEATIGERRLAIKRVKSNRKSSNRS